jgi:hypothetical protein
MQPANGAVAPTTAKVKKPRRDGVFEVTDIEGLLAKVEI